MHDNPYDPYDIVKQSVLHVLMFMRNVNCYDSELESRLIEFLMNVQNAQNNLEK